MLGHNGAATASPSVAQDEESKAASGATAGMASVPQQQPSAESRSGSISLHATASEKGTDGEDNDVAGVGKTDSKESNGKSGDDDDMQGPEILPPARFYPTFAGLLLGVLIISLDNTVVATAQIPIAKAIGGANLISWLPTTFLIGQAVFSVFWGQVLTNFSSKYVYLFNLFFFEVGSLVSALAPTMGTVLAGRTISGVGAAGLFMGAIQILAESTTIEARAIYMGMLGMLFTVSMIVGPIIGGALSKVTWRWIFYINLPIGGAAFVLVAFIFNARPALGTSKSNPLSLTARLRRLDIVGTALLAGFVCMIIIPISEAQNNGWGSAATWAPICLSTVIVGLFVAWLKYAGESHGLVPLRLFRDLSFVGCSLTSFATFWNAILFMYMIPYFFETVRGHSATKSGLDMLALMIPVAVGSLLSGVITRKTGHYYPQLLLCPPLGIAGAAIVHSTPPSGSMGLQIGGQILLGLGIGPVIQGPILVVQANTVDRKLIAKATAMTAFAQRLGGGIGSSVAGAMLYGQLPSHVRAALPAGADLDQYLPLDPTAFFHMQAGPVRDALLRGLTNTINDIYLLGIPMFAICSIAIITLVPIKNITTHKRWHKQDVARKMLCLPARAKMDEPSA